MRSIDQLLRAGAVILDKPVGPSSHQVTCWVKQLLGIPRAGHAGTLDPQVSGLLPILLGKALKLTQIIHSSFRKRYICLIQLHGSAPRSEIERVIAEFRGDLYQLPPLKSAVARKLRIRTLYDSKLLEIQGRNLLLELETQAGFYVRKYCVDLGRALGTGAHMVQLRRIGIGPFTEDRAVTLHQLRDAWEIYSQTGEETMLRRCVLPPEQLMESLPKILVKSSAVDALCHGANLMVPGILQAQEFNKDDWVVVLTRKLELVGVGRALVSSREFLGMDSGEVIDMEAILMEPGTYPRAWKSRSISAGSL